MMRVAISSQGENLEAYVDPGFGRASKFLLVETNSMSFKVIKNSRSLHLPQGAGIQTAQNIISHDPDVVLTGNCGPKAFKVLRAAGVDVVLGVEGKIRDALHAYVEGKFQPATESNVEAHWV